MENFEKVSLANYIDNKVFFTYIEDFKKYICEKAMDNKPGVALLCMKINNIDFINNVFGATAGNEVIDYIIRCVCYSIGTNGIMARFSADYYLIFVECSKKEELVQIIDKINILSDKSDISVRHCLKINKIFSIYFADKSDDFIILSDVDALADKLAMSIAHCDVSDGYFYYDNVVHDRISKEIEIVKSVDKAIENNEFHIFLQPQHYLQHEDRVLSAEALVRWIKKDGTIVYPGDFIPVLEKNGMITKLDCHVMELACKFISQHIDEDWFEGIVISVNVSKVDLKLREFIEYYTNVRNKYKIPDGRIEIEFTESAVFEDYKVFKQIMFELRKSGFYCSIDDFGTGSSSLNMLKSMPVDVLKMDRMFFVCDNENDVERNNSVIASVVAMARGLGMKIVAEGIESPDRIDFLRKIGCDVIQGYVYSKPLSVEDFEKYVKTYIPKYLPVSDKLKPVPPEKYTPENSEMVYQKYLQMLPYVNAIVIELDIESDTYRIISFGKEKFLIIDITGEYSTFFDNVILKNTHSDYRKDVLKKLSLKGILSSFYRGDTEIEHEFMMKLYDIDESALMQEYIWCSYHICFQKMSRYSKPTATIFISDIQEQKEKEISYLSAETKLKAAIKSMKCDILDIDFSENLIQLFHIGDNKDSVFEYDVEQYSIDEYVNEVVVSDDREKVYSILDRIKNIHKVSDTSYYNYTEYRSIISDDDMRWKSISFIKDETVNKNSVTAIVQDITNYRKLQEKVSASQQTLYKFVSAMCSCVIEINFKKEIVHIIKTDHILSEFLNGDNLSDISLSDYDGFIDEMISKSIIHRDDCKDFIDMFSSYKMEQNLAYQSQMFMEYRMMKNNVYRWYEVRIISSSDSGMVFMCDIDERKICELKKERESRRDVVTGVYMMNDFNAVVQEFTEREGVVGEHLMFKISSCNRATMTKARETDFVMCLKKSVRKDDVIARGDDGSYYVFLKSIARSFVGRFVEKTLQIFESQHPEDKELREFCIGISLLVNGNKDVHKMKRETEEALKTAQSRGKNSVFIFGDE